MDHDAERDARALRVDDCWNRIGSRGDRSCPRLVEHRRCVSCPVFEQAAARLLERSESEFDAFTRTNAHPDASASPNANTRARDNEGRSTALPANPPPSARTSPGAPASHAALVFRVAEEWLALPAAALSHVEEPRPVHPLPHRRNPVVLGLVNVRGTLTVAASLAGMLEIERSSAASQTARNGCARMLVVRHGGESAALPVDEVEGLLRYGASDLMPVPATVALAAASHARGVIAWRNTTVGLLDTDRIFASLRQHMR
jgi:chemotaxis-related protein WspD